MSRLLRRKLDGEITDPPVQNISTSARYARPRPRSLSPGSNLLGRSLFCPRCLQNQHIVNQALAEYLPSQDDPRYTEFERKLPQYRKNMEARFPQVCETCAPGVEDRIRSSGYAAKTDHLRRMMDRTRGTGGTYTAWDWRQVLALVGALGWSVGLFAQLSWHILGALPTVHEDGRLLGDDDPQSVSTCLLNLVFHHHSTTFCNDLWQPLLAYALGFSLLCFWWNPGVHHKLRGGYGRIVGHVEYYKLQLMALAMRFLTWKLTAKDSTLAIDTQAKRALHAFGLILGVILTILSFRAIEIDQRPLVLFQDNYEPLVPAIASNDTITASQQQSRRPNPLSRPRVEPFPIDKLAPRPQQPAYQPPTPPPEDDGEDEAMEWTPQHKFQPPITYRAPQAERVFNEPSPFHGAIPPAPISWAQRLRYPPSQPQFRKASEKTKENFFTRNTRRVASDAASDVSSVAPSVADSSIFEIDSPVQFAAPRFFAPTDRMETGLESLFGDAFSLGKEPLLQGQQDVQTAMPPVAFRPLSRLMTSLISGASCVTWDYAPVIHPTSPNLARLVSVAVALMILVYNLVSSIGLLRTYRSLGYTALQGLQCALALVVGRTIRVLSKNGKEKDEINALGLWFLMALTVQEVWGFISSLSAPSVATAVEAPKPLVREKQTPSIAKRTAKGGSQAVVNKAPAASASTALSTKAKSNRVEMTQRTTRSKARNEARGDSLGVDGLGSLSLSGW